MNKRLASVDALRGAVMIVMALDHVRDFFHRGAMLGRSPTDLATTTPILFMTRWVTHICAPVFMFTAGIGAYFYWQNGRTRGQLSAFLVTRGLWLILLELTVMQLAYNFDVSAGYPVFMLVLWVLGGCMVLLAGLVWLPIAWLAVLSSATIVLHHLLDGVQVWNLVHQVSVFQFAGRTVIAPYTLVPWAAVMALGFCLGPILQRGEGQRRRILFGLGAGMTIAFVIVRGLNVYGDPSPWSPQPSVVFTFLSFLNTTKYPPSLSFLLMTLGPAILALAWLDRRTLSRANPLIVFGRVPLFYFVLHFFAAHALAVVFAVISHGSAAWSFMFQPVPSMGGPIKAFPPGFGYDLWVAYAVWIAIVAGLYPLCRWFATVKSRRHDWWVSYV